MGQNGAANFVDWFSHAWIGSGGTLAMRISRWQITNRRIRRHHFALSFSLCFSADVAWFMKLYLLALLRLPTTRSHARKLNRATTKRKKSVHFVHFYVFIVTVTKISNRILFAFIGFCRICSGRWMSAIQKSSVCDMQNYAIKSSMK